MQAASAYHHRPGIARILGRFNGLFRALAWIGAYTGWVLAVRLLVLTLITYFVSSGATAGRPIRFEDISEAISANELSLLGFSALLFVLFVKLASPIGAISWREVFSPERFEERFVPGFFHGALVASGLLLAFLLSGLYRYLGLVLTPAELPMALPGIGLRALALGALVYCEEYIFRQRITAHLRAWNESQTLSPRISRYADAFAIVATAVAYAEIKILQIDAELGWMHLATLFLISVALSLRTLADGDFARGAGFWAAALIVFNPLLSLPIFGSEFSGLLLVNYHSAAAAAGGSGDETLSATSRFFTGGAGGPLSSFAFQLLLILDIARGILRYRRANPIRTT